MPPITFLCPDCNTALRIRDRGFVGHLVACPDCRASLRIVEDEEGRIFAEPSAPPEPSPVAGIDVPLPDEEAGPGLRLEDLAQVPEDEPAPVPVQHSLSSHTAQIVAWSVAAVCLLALLPFLMPSKRPPSEPESAAVASNRDSAPQENPAAPPKPAPPAEAPAEPLPATVEGRLAKLGELLLSDLQAKGHFPAGSRGAEGLPQNQRFSWLAELAARLYGRNAPAPLWDRAWRDHLNDRFARRGIPLFQNPDVPEKAGSDGYPATHFVGVAGVGKDAPGLPVNHPRAGIFGNDRRTTLNDIKDGTSETMLVAGAQAELGSWASASAAVRPFTREPYVNGPDGFGTGQSDGMLVLMADGSVKTISKSMDPKLVRRMAAMADGLPLDAAVPGEPGDRPAPTPPPKPAPQVAQTPAPANPPIVPAPPVNQNPDRLKAVVDAVLANKPEAPPPIDVAAALRQKIKRIEQTKPARLTDLLLLVEELAGVPIRYDREQLGADASKLDEQISFTLDEPTARDVLETILERAGLGYRIEANRIQIVPIAEPPARASR